MTPQGALLPLLCLLLAISSSKLLVIRFGVPRPLGRFESIDGLRGYLALAVFVSHIAVWHDYLRTDRWQDPSSRLYVHFGQSSVAIFFMITSFLFFSKLLDSREKPLDWTRLYVSRFLRLFPLYLFVMFLLFAAVAYLSAGTLRVTASRLIYSCLHWITFTILGGPDINEIQGTANIVAGVTWSLPYELFFYASLPVLGLPLSVRSPPRYLLMSIIGIAGFLMLRPFPMRLLAFAGGIVAAIIVRNESLRNLATKPSMAIVAALCVCLTLALFPTAYAPVPLLLLSIAFIIIACGNTLFGALTSDCSRMLGDASYSIYLLHGILLFSVFRFLIGVDRAMQLSTTKYCAIAALCTPVLIAISFASYRMIEVPGMRRVPGLEAWLQTRLRWAMAAQR